LRDLSPAAIAAAFGKRPCAVPHVPQRELRKRPCAVPGMDPRHAQSRRVLPALAMPVQMAVCQHDRVLAGKVWATALGGAEAFVLSLRVPRNVRGYPQLRSYRLRRSHTAP